MSTSSEVILELGNDRLSAPQYTLLSFERLTAFAIEKWPELAAAPKISFKVGRNYESVVVEDQESL